MAAVKHSVAVVVRGEPGAFLVVKRPEDPDDPLAGVWGLPAITLRDGETERDAVIRAGRVKLGAELAVGDRIGEQTSDRGSYVLTLADYEATVIGGTVTVPQPAVPSADGPMTQYTEAAFVTDPAVLADAARKGSLCARIFLEAAGRDGTAGRDATAEIRP
ncbi:MAG TPA: NUDIX hydrolase [Trebonia sp.]|nr:NUDIX hydrolase [Trebonia sp.]